MVPAFSGYFIRTRVGLNRIKLCCALLEPAFSHPLVPLGVLHWMFLRLPTRNFRAYFSPFLC